MKRGGFNETIGGGYSYLFDGSVSTWGDIDGVQARPVDEHFDECCVYDVGFYEVRPEDDGLISEYQEGMAG
jgi:hypothetical protein